MAIITHDTPDSSTENSPDRIEVLEMQHIDGRGAVKATCRIRIGQIVISGARVVLPTLASRPFVGMPSRKNGEQWDPIISVLSPELEAEIATVVLAAWRKGSAR